jgi:hypothetical protein
MEGVKRCTKKDSKFRVLGIRQSMTEIRIMAQKVGADRAVFFSIDILEKLDLSKHFSEKDINFIKNMPRQIPFKLA